MQEILLFSRTQEAMILVAAVAVAVLKSQYPKEIKTSTMPHKPSKMKPLQEVGEPNKLQLGLQVPKTLKRHSKEPSSQVHVACKAKA